MWRKDELVDCLDPYKKWLSAKIIELRPSQDEKVQGSEVKVTYLDFGSKYDEWISLPEQSIRILKQFRGSHPDTPSLKTMMPQSFNELEIN